MREAPVAPGTAAFQQVLDQALSLFDFVWLSATDPDIRRRLGKPHRDLNNPDHRAAIEGELNAKVDTIRDRTVQLHWRQAVRQKMRELGRPAREFRPAHVNLSGPSHSLLASGLMQRAAADRAKGNPIALGVLLRDGGRPQPEAIEPEEREP